MRSGTRIDTGKKIKYMQKNDAPKSIMQFKVVLGGIEPDIWRRILVNGEINLRTFAVSIILGMGWKNSHLHEFIIEGKHYGIMDDDAIDMLDELPMEDEIKYKIKDFSKEQLKSFVFSYDFGDGWEHDVIFEGFFELEDGVSYPLCIAGARNCPPEDCGGIGGYYDLIEKLKNPDDEEYEGLVEWLGGKYDPDFFDADVINATLKNTDAYERYGFEGDESAGDIIDDEYINCGIGTAAAGKVQKNKTTASPKKRRAGKQTTGKKPVSGSMDIWNNIQDKHKKFILESVYCVKCMDVTTIKDYTFHPEDGCLVIRGKCSKCGHEVARVLEGK